jgi:hypothetical protein
MKHLSPEQIVDLADGCPDGAVAAHAAACDACRAKLDSLLEAIRLAAEGPQPEPSPLFWPHLADRIGQAVRREPSPGAFWRVWAWRLASLGATAVVVVAIGIGARVWPWTQGSPALAPSATAGAPLQVADEAPAEVGPVDDASWRLVSDLSAEVSVDEAEASGALPLPGGMDGALLHLDGAERMELARILREEMAPRGSAAWQGPGA